MTNSSNRTSHYNKQQLVDALRTVGVRRGDVVFSHSNIGFLGYPLEGTDANSVCKVILDAFLEVLGPEGTLIVPTFSYSFCRQEVFDPKVTPSTSGIFTEYVRKHPNAVRSLEPIFSVSAIGAQAIAFASDVSNDCFGQDSIWDRLMNADASIVNIGIGVGSTFIHYIEQTLGIQYRYRKLFTGEIVNNDKRYKKGVIYFVRDLTQTGATPNWLKLEPEARADGSVNAAIVGRGEINRIECRRLFELCKNGLGRDPAYLVDGPLKINVSTSVQEKPASDFTEQTTMVEMIEGVWKLPRDIISDGYDRALFRLGGAIDMHVHEYPTGTECWTWIIPEKWTCHEAFVESLSGNRILSYADNPLHVLSYSLPFDGIVSREVLLKHLYVHPKLDNAIPFKFKYYERDWGLCCSRNTMQTMTDDQYRVVIKTDFSSSTLKVGEVILPGTSEDSIVLCAHLCHPAMVNDGLTGVVAGIEVMRRLKELKERHYTYRLLILPETIGSLAWLSHNESLFPQLKGGLFFEMLGMEVPHALQLSFEGNTQIDKCFINALKELDPEGWTGKFRTIVGNDERQFNAPGVRVPMLSLCRLQPGYQDWPYPEYHSQLDDPSLITPSKLEDSVTMILKMISNLERNYIVHNRFKGEVFCSRYGISIDYYTNFQDNFNMFKIMDLIDGTRTIADIAEQCELPFESCWHVIDQLKRNRLVDYSR